MNISPPIKKLNNMKIELTEKELEFIIVGLNLLTQNKLEELNNYAIEYSGFNPSGMSEFTKLVNLSKDFDELEKLEGKLVDILKNAN